MGVFPAFFGLLMAALVTGQSIEITPREAVRRLGDELEVLCKVDYPIESCRMSIGKTSYILRPGDNEGEVIYHGQGLQSGECGAHIRNVKEEWNGLIMCYLPPKSGSIEVTGTMRLTVAKPPTDPVLITPLQPAFKEGDVFTAQCVVAGGRPTAKITWLLDDEELLAGVHQPIVTPEPESDLQTISQNVSRTLRADDAGRILTCRAEHEALLQPREVKRQLIVHYPPKVESESITIFGLQLNVEGRLNVTVRAQPPPRAEWSVGDHRLVAPMMSEDGLVSALEPLPLGGGYYNVTLVLSQIRKDDVDRPYYLRLSNELGNGGLITIRISTMEEPAGVELDTGAIVGIVIAVLVLLIALSLVVFAFATDRWCFAGRSHRLDLPDADSEAPLPSHDDVKGSENPSHDHGDFISNGNTKLPEKKPDTAVRRDTTKSSGESSDTESAVGGKERSRLAQLSARVRAALPKGRDKVQATEAAPQEEEDNKPTEDKVVYATLALSEHTPAEKPPPAFAEYAEIVYTDQQKDVKENA